MMKNKEKNFISAVVYVHNNEIQIEKFLQQINKIFASNFEKYEIICVNDASTDQSSNAIQKFSKTAQEAVVSIIQMSFFQGVELSMNAGVDLAIGDFVFEFDHTNRDYDLDMIMEIYRQALNGYDIVNAAPSEAASKMSSFFYALFNRFAKTSYKLRTESFRILSRRVINRIHSMNKTIPYRKALYANCGLKMDTIIYKKVTDIEVTVDAKVKTKRQEMAVDSLILFTDIAYNFARSLTIFMMMISLFIMLYTVSVYIEKQPVAGWTSMMLLLSFGFFGIFAIAAVIIKYLAIIVDLVFKKKSYIIQSIDKVTK